MSLQLPNCPASLKGIQHYLKTASEHEQRDPVVTYWCRLYALQAGLKMDKKSTEAKLLLVTLMDWLEKEKKNLADNEAITNDIAAQAHIENYALKLFVWADTQDRAGNFNKYIVNFGSQTMTFMGFVDRKGRNLMAFYAFWLMGFGYLKAVVTNVVKSFYTAGMLMDILTTFGELTEEITANCKYAKWKAAYIHNCLKNGETPIAGPFQVDEDGQIRMDDSPPQNNSFDLPQKPPETEVNLPHVPSISPEESKPNTPYTPMAPPTPLPVTQSGVPIDPTMITKAQKYCKFASSALNFDDVSEAIGHLQKALHLLQTGQDI